MEGERKGEKTVDFDLVKIKQVIFFLISIVKTVIFICIKLIVHFFFRLHIGRTATQYSRRGKLPRVVLTVCCAVL